MARSESVSCDICKKECSEIVGKLFFSPMTRSNGAKSFHNNYSLHLDVGECCVEKLHKGFRWSPRMSAKAYADKRRRHKVKS